MTKEIVATAIMDLPPEFELDVLFEKLVFMERVEIARIQAEKKQTITHTEMKNVIASWQK